MMRCPTATSFSAETTLKDYGGYEAHEAGKDEARLRQWHAQRRRNRWAAEKKGASVSLPHRWAPAYLFMAITNDYYAQRENIGLPGRAWEHGVALRQSCHQMFTLRKNRTQMTVYVHTSTYIYI